MKDDLAARLAELLAQSALKNQRAFADLYQLTAAKLYGVALRILRRQDWAEEVLQECYVNIWNHAGDYAVQKSAPLTWMTSIVRNRCLDWLRRPQQEATGMEYDIAVEAWQDDSPGPMEQLLLQRVEPFGGRGPHEAAARHGEDLGAPRPRAPEGLSFRRLKRKWTGLTGFTGFDREPNQILD